MMFKKKAMASAMTAALVAGAMLSSGAQAVRLSETGAGNTLLGPVYLAGAAGYDTTTVRVVNPSTVDAIKAKVVLRSRMNSEECRDFLLYLSPGDVATFDITDYTRDANGTRTGMAGTGMVQVWSNDDSLLSSRTTVAPFATFGSQAGAAFNSLSVNMAGGTAPALSQAGDTCQVGHIEVIGVYAARGTVGTPSGNVTINNNTAPNGIPTSKFDLLRIFDSSAPAPVGFARNLLTGDVTGNAGATANYSSRVQLSGTVEIKNSATGDAMFYHMAALRDGINPTTAGVSTPVIANPLYDAGIGAETGLGVAMGAAGTDNLADIEGALIGSASTHYGMYRNGLNGVNTNMVMTFPTKYRHRTNPTIAPATYNPPFFTNGQVQYTMDSLGMSEDRAGTTPGSVCLVSPCPTPVITGSFMTDEVNYVWTPTQYSASGWYNVTLTGITGAANIPAIGYTHSYVGSNNQLNNSRLDMLSRPYVNP